MPLVALYVLDARTVKMFTCLQGLMRHVDFLLCAFVTVYSANGVVSIQNPVQMSPFTLHALNVREGGGGGGYVLSTASRMSSGNISIRVHGLG